LGVKVFRRLHDIEGHDEEYEKGQGHDEKADVQPISDVGNDGVKHDFSQSPILSIAYQKE
jgi:hypothetical protein